MQIFISYAHADRAWYDRLRPHIDSAVRANAGAECRIFSDQNIQAGEAWDDRIRGEIRDADLMILLGTAAFVSSKYISTTELPLILAKSNQAALFPILVTSVSADYAAELRRIQWQPSGSSLAQLAETPEFDEHLLQLMNDLGRRVRDIKRTSMSSFRQPTAAAQPPQLCSGMEMLPSRSFGEIPFVRVNFAGIGRDLFHVEIEARTPQGHFDAVPMTLQLDAKTSAQNYCDRIFSNVNARRMLGPLIQDAMLRRTPIRIQFVFDRTARYLDQIAWETLLWNDRPLGMSSDYIFSRQFSFPDADSGDLQIKPKGEISYCRVYLCGEPQEVDADIRWSSPLLLGPQNSRKFPEIWEFSYSDGAMLAPLNKQLREAEVIYLAWAAAIDTDKADQLLIPWPHKRGELVRAPVEALCDRIAAFGAEQPSLIILAPRSERNTEINRLFAHELAAAHVPAVLAPVGEVPPEVWETLLSRLADDLEQHGVIDLAVSAARTYASQHGFSLILYLRSRSARLWYRPSFVNMSGEVVDAGRVLNQLGEALSTQDPTSGELEKPIWPPPCIALVGSNLSRELSLSRREIAVAMAKKYGFSLSRKDREDLETVAEYVFVSQPRISDARPHVSAFVDVTKNYLIRRFADDADEDLSDKSLYEISQLIWSRRKKSSKDVFDKLGRLKVSAYLTSYYHKHLESALDQKKRTPTSANFRRDAEANALHVDHYDPPTIASPLVYHCFGSFERQESILVSKSDYLDFFAAFCRRNVSDDVTADIRAMLASSMLLILGFRPNSSELRLLLAIYRELAGRSLSHRRTHIAVQIDPEDDHTIDPEKARSFYQGLMSEFGKDVYLYWGTTEEFLCELEKAHPNIFLPP